MALIGIVGKMQSGKDTVGKIIQMLTDNLLEGIPEEAVEDCVLNTPILNPSFKIVKFADKLKDMVCLLIGCTREDLENDTFKDTPLGKEWEIKTVSYIDRERHTVLNPTPYQAFDIKCKYPVSYEESTSILTPRKILQLLGTECGRQIIHPNIWVNATMANYKPNGAPYDSLGDVFDDLKLCPSETKMPNWIITDCRFPNEAQAIKDRGGIIIKVMRDTEGRFPLLYKEWRETTYSDFYCFLREKYPAIYGKITHESEIALDGYTEFDNIVYNDTNMYHTLLQVKSILDKNNIHNKF